MALPAALDRTPAGERRERTDEVLRAVGLWEARGRMPSELSGGEQQRVAIGRAIMNRPKILLADEPTGNLDIPNGRAILDLLRSLQSDGQTTVVVTHDPAVASYAERVVLMADGRLRSEIRPDAPGDVASVLRRI